MATKRKWDLPEVDKAKKSKQQEELITADEVKLYDRQIRLWGMEAQQRMRNARILVIGMSALSNELLKNIILAGVCHVTLMSSDLVTERDLGAQFFLRSEDIGKNVFLY
jgi:ubiquitin-like 1-activating enzyme E1 A